MVEHIREREHHLDEVIAAYVDARDAGQHPDHREWLARYPDLAAELVRWKANVIVATTAGAALAARPQGERCAATTRHAQEKGRGLSALLRSRSDWSASGQLAPQRD